MLCAILSLSFSLVALASTTSPANISQYQTIVDKLNKELGASMSIPNNVEVYNNISQIPLDKFEAYLRNEYITANTNNKENNIIYMSVNNTNTPENDITGGTRVPALNENSLGLDSIVQPYSVSQEILQKVNLPDFYGAVDLSSIVFSATGAIGTYIYDTIINMASYDYTNMTYFRANTSSYVLSNGSKTCTVTYKGTLITKEGIDLLIAKTYVIAYQAN